MRARHGLKTSRNLSWPINGFLQTLRTVLVLLVLSVVMPASAGPRYSSRIVETKTGSIRGVILELHTKHLEPVEVFKAVPYAQPPIEALRFESPQKLAPWPGTKLADTFGPVCPQIHPDVTNRTAALLQMPIGRYQYLRKLLPLLVNQSEDCLTLNIYVPGSGNRGLEAPYSVLFFIHGESFEWGSGNPYDGSVLASYGHVIVITVNFRLGILGFLKTRSNNPPGNLGVLDIITALRWTKENIAAFGGDPNRVTIVGQDTGAALANLILISKEAKGLMHRTILLSGSALSPWAMAQDPDAVREEVSQQMACHLAATTAEQGNAGDVPSSAKKAPSSDVTNDITGCLKSKPLEALMGVRLPSIRFMPAWAPYSDTAPDADFAMEHSGESFITSQLMLGMTTMESYNDFSSTDIQYGLEEDQRNKVMRTFVRNAFTFHLNEIFSAIRNEYTDWDKPIQHPINIRDSTMEALSDGHTIAPLMRVGYLHARRGAKTYIFHFNYQTKDSDYPQRLGSVRGEDVPYVFGLPLVMGLPSFGLNYTRQDMGVAEAVLNFISNFCKTGDPNDAGHQQAFLHPDYGTEKERTRYRGLTWETYEPTTQQYLSISSKPKMKSHYRGHKMAMWLNLIPQLHKPGDAEVSMRHHHFREKEATYFDGSLRTESLNRPRYYYGQELVNGGVQESRQDPQVVDCRPDDTLLLVSGDAVGDGAGGGDGEEDNDFNSLDAEDEEELLDKFMKKHYYSYTAALGVTVGVGCLLLILNMLIFAGIYYQRDRSRRKNRLARRSSNEKSSSGSLSGNSSDGQRSNLNPGDSSDIPLVTTSGHSSGSTVSGGGGGVCTVMTANCKAAKQINRNKKSGSDSPPTYSLAQQQQGHYHPTHHDQHQIHLVSGSSGGSPSNLHNSASVTVSINTQEQHHHLPIVDLYHQQQQPATALTISNAVSDRLRSDGTATLGRRGAGTRTAEAAGEVPTCSPGKTLYKCSTLGRKMSTNAAPHFHNHLLHHQHLPSSSGSGVGGAAAYNMSSGGGGGGSVVGITMGAMRSGQQFSSTNELPIIIPMPLTVDQQPNNNVPILNSILTSTSSGAGHNNNNHNSNNNYPMGSSGSGNPGNNPGSSSTIKKRVQIQEVTV